MSNDYPPPPPPPAGYGYGAAAQRPFSAGDAFGYGWRTFWRNAGPFLLVALLMWVVTVVLDGIGSALSGGELSTGALFRGTTVSVGSSAVAWIFSVLASVATVFFNAAMVRGALDVVDGRPVAVASMFERWDKLAVLIAAVIVSVLTFIGFVLCVLPGVAVAFLAWFTTFFIVDRGLGPWDAVKASFSFSSGRVGPLLLCALIGVLVLLIGLALCGVGLLFAGPIVALASAYAYRALHDQPVAGT